MHAYKRWCSKPSMHYQGLSYLLFDLIKKTFLIVWRKICCLELLYSFANFSILFCIIFLPSSILHFFLILYYIIPGLSYIFPQCLRFIYPSHNSTSNKRVHTISTIFISFILFFALIALPHYCQKQPGTQHTSWSNFYFCF